MIPKTRSLAIILVMLLVGLSLIIGLSNIHFHQPRATKTKTNDMVTSVRKAGFIHAQGNKLVDEKGEQIVLRGFNMGFIGTVLAYRNSKGRVPIEVVDSINDEKIRNLFTEWDFKNMGGIGANSFRVFLRFYALETEPYKYDEGLLKTYDYLVDTGHKNGIYIVLTLCWAGQNRNENINNGLGNSLWTNPDLRARVIAAWKHIAEHYKDNPGVAGYDILNEPTAPDKQSLHSFYLDAIKAIREVDKNHLIILERESMAKTREQRDIHWAGEYSDENVMFEDHYYNDAAGHKYADMSVPLPKYDTKEKMRLRLMWDVAKAKTRPVYIGEFGALWRAGEEGLRWTRDLIDLMNENGFSWAYFPYKKMVHREGNIRGWYASKKSLPALSKRYIKSGRLTEEYKALLHTWENYQENPKVREVLAEGFKSK